MAGSASRERQQKLTYSRMRQKGGSPERAAKVGCAGGLVPAMVERECKPGASWAYVRRQSQIGDGAVPRAGHCTYFRVVKTGTGKMGN